MTLLGSPPPSWSPSFDSLCVMSLVSLINKSRFMSLVSLINKSRFPSIVHLGPHSFLIVPVPVTNSKFMKCIHSGLTLDEYEKLYFLNIHTAFIKHLMESYFSNNILIIKYFPKHL